jgi:hypothetical protein
MTETKELNDKIPNITYTIKNNVSNTEKSYTEIYNDNLDEILDKINLNHNTDEKIISIQFVKINVDEINIINLNTDTLYCLFCNTKIFKLNSDYISYFCINYSQITDIEIYACKLISMNIYHSEIQNIIDIQAPLLNTLKISYCDIAPNIFIENTTENNSNNLLEFPNLSELKIIKTPIKHIKNLNIKNISSLIIEETNIENLDFDFPKLEHLNLQNNNLTKIFDDNTIINLPLLDELEVNNNQLTQLFAPADIPNIRKIYSSNNKIRIIEEYTNLILLFCTNNALDSIEIGPHLINLHIVNNPKLQISDVRNLQTLFMSQGQLSPDIKINSFKKLNKLIIYSKEEIDANNSCDNTGNYYAHSHDDSTDDDERG